MNIKNSDKYLFGLSLFILGLGAGMILFHSNSPFDISQAIAQSMRSGSAGGIMAFPGQVDKDTYGIIMVDVDAGTMWIYGYSKQGKQLKLLAARSWLYDRYLEDYNCGSPTPSEVSDLISTYQRKQQKNQNSETLEIEGKK